MENTISLFITIIGAFLGSWSAFFFSQRAHKTKLTLEFHKEFYGPEMSKHRRIADDLIKKFPNTNYSDLEIIESEHSISLIIIMMFFERLWQCARTHQLKNKMAGDLFLYIFCYWYFVSYEDNLLRDTKNWPAKNEMPKLFSWLANQYSQTDTETLIETNKKIKLDRINEKNYMD